MINDPRQHFSGSQHPTNPPSLQSKPTIAANHARPAGPPVTARPVADDDMEPISLVEEDSDLTQTQTTAPPKKIMAFGPEGHHARVKDWKRQTHKTGTGATRVKSFHGKYSEQGLEYLDNAINEWLDNSPEVEVKFVTSTVMTFEGKIREPALVLNVWY